MARYNPGEILFTTAGPNIRPNPPRAVSITWDAGGEEFRVRVVGNSREDYFTNDYDDAVATAKVMAQGGEVSDKTPKSKRPKSNPRKSATKRTNGRKRRNPNLVIVQRTRQGKTWDVLGKRRLFEGSLIEENRTYANRTQAYKALESMPAGEGWSVYQWGRPFYIAREAISTRRNGYGGGSKTGETALRYAYLWGKRARTSKQFGSSMDEAAANWLNDELVFTSLTRPERVAWESAFNRGWLDAVKKNASRRNGAKSVADPVAARELELYIENEYALVGAANSIGKAVMKNLAQKMARGTYDATKAWKGWMYLVDEGAKRYNREFGTKFGVGAFNKATREMVAVRLAEVFESEVKSGTINVSELIGKANPARRK